jgi:hypothetical protein
VLLGFLRCTGGVGDVPLPSWTVPYPLLRRLVRLARASRLLSWLRLARPRDPIEQHFLGHFGLQMLRRNHVWFYTENLAPGIGKRVGMLRQYAQIERMIADAVRRVGPRARVAVFPLGGATYTRGPNGQE